MKRVTIFVLQYNGNEFKKLQKIKIMKGQTQNQKDLILNKTYFDCRLEDYFIVNEDAENNDNFVWIEYQNKKHRSKREAVSFITYHIDEKQYLLKIY